MPFVPIYPTHQGPIPEILAKKLRTGGIENLSFFESAILIICLLYPHENQSTFIMGRNFDDYPGQGPLPCSG